MHWAFSTASLSHTHPLLVVVVPLLVLVLLYVYPHVILFARHLASGARVLQAIGPPIAVAFLTQEVEELISFTG